MDVDCTNMLDLYLANETTNTHFDSVWPEGYVFSANNNKMTDENDKRDIQDLFNGETNLNGELDDGNRCLESWEGGASTPDVKGITDEEITNLPVQKLNKLLRNVPWEEAAKIRKRRRNLKNRRYSLSCRLRKQREQEDQINENSALKKKLENGKMKLIKVWKEKETYKRKYLQLQKCFAEHNQGVEIS